MSPVLTLELIRQMSPFIWPCRLSPHKPTQLSDTVGLVLILLWPQLEGVCKPKSTPHPTPPYNDRTINSVLQVLCPCVLFCSFEPFVFAGCWKNEDWAVCRCGSQDRWEFSVRRFKNESSVYSRAETQSIYSELPNYAGCCIQSDY